MGVLHLAGPKSSILAFGALSRHGCPSARHVRPFASLLSCVQVCVCRVINVVPVWGAGLGGMTATQGTR
eukprot:9820944-Alexandrium_andersonii.AAC.1